jgi:hypothetical protein
MMKNLYRSSIFVFTGLILFIINIIDIKAATECDSVNLALTSKFRFLGGWNADGTPEYLQPIPGDVTPAMINFVNTTLPESVNLPNSDDEYFGDNIQFNTELNEASEVFLTMVHEGAGWKNTLGYYTYEINNPPATVYDIDSMVVIFPNVSQMEVVQPGNKVLLGEFPAGTGIGYFLIADGWTGDTICLKSHIVFSDPDLNTFTTEAYQQQTILLNYVQQEQLLLCFEDIMRPGGDNDFNDAVFYITAEPGAIDTTDIPKIPTAYLSGDTTVCAEDATVKLKVELSGKAPWTIVYTNGKEEVTIDNIDDEEYYFETTLKDTITLVSVKDKFKYGITEGEAIVNVGLPTAIIEDYTAGCGDETATVYISLTGVGPWNIGYTINDEPQTVGSTVSILELKITEEGIFALTEVHDANCDNSAEGKVEISFKEVPTAAIEDYIPSCGEIGGTVNISLTGTAPWEIAYTLNDELQTAVSEDNLLSLDLNQESTFNLVNVQDANCENGAEGSLNIELNELPSAIIEDYSAACGESVATVYISLTGVGPWNIGYTINDEPQTVSSTESKLELEITEEGIFALTEVHDANCDNSVEGSIDIVFYDTPTGIISGGGVLCNEEEAAVEINLAGTAPFNIVYTDGETETTVTTEEYLYQFETTVPGIYTLVSVDDANCTGEVSGSADITDGTEGIQAEIDTDDTSCFGEDINLVLLGDTNDLTVLWTTDGTGTFDNDDQANVVYTPREGETGTVEFFAELDNGCAVKTISKKVVIYEELDASFSYSPSKDLLTNSTITFTPEETGYESYYWDFGDGNSSTASMSSTEYTKGGVYTVSLKVGDSGCENEGSAELEVLSKDELYVPNAFNPGAQNPENRVVKVYGNNVEENGFAFRIVNRWGKTMYETDSFMEANSSGWNGVNDKNGSEQELNVFTYILKGKFIDGQEFSKVGTITQVK